MELHAMHLPKLGPNTGMGHLWESDKDEDFVCKKKTLQNII